MHPPGSSVTSPFPLLATVLSLFRRQRGTSGFLLTGKSRAHHQYTEKAVLVALFPLLERLHRLLTIARVSDDESKAREELPEDDAVQEKVVDNQYVTFVLAWRLLATAGRFLTSQKVRS